MVSIKLVAACVLTAFIPIQLEAFEFKWRQYAVEKKFSKRFAKAAIVSDTPICSKVGKDILKKNGSAVDAAIAAMLCIGTVNFQSTGIGGGGYMTIFDKKSGKTEVIDFRETVPSGIKDEDFREITKLSNNYSIDERLNNGGKSIAVPGMLKGFEVAHQRFGRLPWKTLFEPAAKIAEKGFNLTLATRGSYLIRQTSGLNSSEFSVMRKFLKPLESLWIPDLIFKNPALATTLRILGDAGNSDPFYRGSLGQEIVKVIREYNGTMTTEDLRNYKAIIRKPIVTKLHNRILYSPPPPAGGITLASILEILSAYKVSSRDLDTVEKQTAYNHKLIEAMKWSYSKANLLCDPDYFELNSVQSYSVQEIHKDVSRRRLKAFKALHQFLDKKHFSEIRKKISEERTFSSPLYYGEDGLVGHHQGTTHLSVLSEDGSAVAMTTSINNYFGSLVLSEKLGVILNNQLKDFRDVGAYSFGRSSTYANYLVTGKRPSSYMSPSIVLDSNGDVCMVMGAAGGSKIPSALAQIFLDYFWLKMDLKNATVRSRIHSQLAPDYVFVEEDFPLRTRKKLELLGHKVTDQIQLLTGTRLSPYSVTNVIGVKERTSNALPVEAVSDPRKLGEPDGY